MSLDNYFVVRKNPKGGFSYVEGYQSDPRNQGTDVFINIPVTDVSKVYDTFDDCMVAALEEDAEHGVVTHPECSLDDVISDIRAFEDSLEYYTTDGTQIKKKGKVIKNPVFELTIRAADKDWNIISGDSGVRERYYA